MNGNKVKFIGILTSGEDCLGLNLTIPGVAKTTMHHGIKFVGFQDGFRRLFDLDHD